MTIFVQIEKKINYENIKKKLFLQPAWLSKILQYYLKNDYGLSAMVLLLLNLIT